MQRGVGIAGNGMGLLNAKTTTTFCIIDPQKRAFFIVTTLKTSNLNVDIFAK
jgi:hypothetical protein